MLTRFALVGALALTLVACQPGQRICEGDKAQRTACILLIVGAVKAVKLVALSHHHGEPVQDNFVE
jgi:hypothetical protein